jgi:hypothetical protein
VSGAENSWTGLSVRAVAREAAWIYRANFWALIIVALVVFIPAGLAEAVADLLSEVDAEDVGGLEVAEGILAAAALTLTASLGDVFYTGVITAIVGEHRTGSHRSLGEIARQIPYWRLIAVDLVFALIVAFGLLLLIVPGVIAFTWFCLAAPVVEIEEQAVAPAFRRSRELVRGNFWRVLGILGPVLLAGDLLAEAIQEWGPHILGEGFIEHGVTFLVADALTAPFFALLAIVITHQLIAVKGAG